MFDILLATYNGAAHLPALLASLDQQTEKGWRLIHRDDGSDDHSPEIVTDWAERTQRTLISVKDARGRLGTVGNFGVLLEVSDAPYFLPCDQDDIWHTEKIEVLSGAMKSIEAKSGVETPSIVHSDLAVVDDALQPIHPSFWHYQKIVLPGRIEPWKLMALHNSVTGCAMIGNAALRRLAHPIPRNALMHDWWLALVAASFGEVKALPLATVDYRQHPSNALGAKNLSNFAILLRGLSSPVAAMDRTRSTLTRTQDQAAAFLERYSDRLSNEQLRFFCEYSRLRHLKFLARKRFFFRHKLWFGSAIRDLSLLIAA